MLSRLLLAAGLAGLLGLSDGFSQAGPEPAPAPRPQKPKDEPRKPKDEPKKPKDEPKRRSPRAPRPRPSPRRRPARSRSTTTSSPRTPRPTGVFAVHRIDDKVYFEIPQELGQLLLWRAEVAKGPAGGGWGGNGPSRASRSSSFERRGQQDLRLARSRSPSGPTARRSRSAVEAAQTDSDHRQLQRRGGGQGPVRRVVQRHERRS